MKLQRGPVHWRDWTHREPLGTRPAPAKPAWVPGKPLRLNGLLDVFRAADVLQAWEQDGHARSGFGRGMPRTVCEVSWREWAACLRSTRLGSDAAQIFQRHCLSLPWMSVAAKSSQSSISVTSIYAPEPCAMHPEFPSSLSSYWGDAKCLEAVKRLGKWRSTDRDVVSQFLTIAIVRSSVQHIDQWGCRVPTVSPRWLALLKSMAKALSAHSGSPLRVSLDFSKLMKAVVGAELGSWDGESAPVEARPASPRMPAELCCTLALPDASLSASLVDHLDRLTEFWTLDSEGHRYDNCLFSIAAEARKAGWQSAVLGLSTSGMLVRAGDAQRGCGADMATELSRKGFRNYWIDIPTLGNA